MLRATRCSMCGVDKAASIVLHRAMPKSLREHLQKIGREGGKSKSAAKMQAMAKNLKKAQERRKLLAKHPGLRNNAK